MDKCRTCLTTPANKDISQLEKGIDEYNTHYPDVMLFCLDIKVTQDSKITLKLCNDCYGQIISFYKFKTLSLKNDAYLKSLDSEVSVENQKISEDEDENRIQRENLETDECGPSLVGCMIDPESSLVECILDAESDDEPLIDVNSVRKKAQDIIDETSGKAADKKQNRKKGKTLPLYKRFGHPKKAKRQDIKNVIQGRQVCEECGVSVLDLKQHSLRHQPKDERAMLQCKACPKMFLTKGGRRRHYKTTHLGLKSKCDICNKEVIHLSTHKIQVHNPAAAPFGCATCARRFVSQGALQLHQVTHTEDRAFECDVCHEKFRSKGFVARHIRRVHKKEKNHQCEICSKAFFDKSILQEHIGSHTIERQFLCPECGKAFATRDSLRKHRLVHSHVRKYRCALCDKSFKVHSYLRSHMLSHTKQKSHACGQCGSRRLHEDKHQRTTADAGNSRLSIEHTAGWTHEWTNTETSPGAAPGFG